MINFFGIIHQSGGGGPELLGAIELLRSKNVAVRCIVPEKDPITKGRRASYLRSIGCAVVNYRAGMFKKCAILMTLSEDKCFEYMMKYDDRPKWMVWSSCMSFVIDKEIEAYENGLIDEYFFQTTANGNLVGPQLVKSLGQGAAIRHRKNYHPYLNVDSPYQPLCSLPRHREVFTVGKATRDDPQKWDMDSWKTFSNIVAPANRKVKIEILGWGERARALVGDPCDPTSRWNGSLNLHLRCHEHSPNKMRDFYSRIHVLLHYYPFIENHPIAIAQAMLSGAIPVCSNAPGFNTQIIHGETGFLCNTADEASYYASHLAFDEGKRAAMSIAAKNHTLTEGAGCADRSWPWWKELLDLHGDSLLPKKK